MQDTKLTIKKLTVRILIKLISLLILIVPGSVYAAIRTVGPSDCSASAVNSAITAASDGDTVELTCTGSVTWSSTVSIPSTKGITLKGPGTNTPKSSANFPLTIVSNQNPAILVTCGASHAVSRVTGFKFQGSNTSGDSGFIRVSGTGGGSAGLGAYRIDNNYLDAVSGATIVGIMSSSGTLNGLIDNNTFMNCWRSTDPDYGPYGIQVWNDYRASNGCWGGNGWTDPFSFGGNNFHFIEDNLFQNDTKYMRHYISAELGGRYVARHNIVNVTTASPGGNNTDPFEAHGFCICSSNGAGARGGEVYANEFKGDKMGRPITMRGGHWLIYDNTFAAVGYTGSPVNLLEYRAGDSGMYGQCTSPCPCTSAWYPQVSDSPSRYPLEQQVTKTYIWNNTYNGANQSPRVDTRGYQSYYIQQDRDYFVSASKPSALSYTAYAYPHPLRGSAPPPPPALSPPTGLRIIP